MRIGIVGCFLSRGFFVGFFFDFGVSYFYVFFWLVEVILRFCFRSFFFGVFLVRFEFFFFEDFR